MCLLIPTPVAVREKSLAPGEERIGGIDRLKRFPIIVVWYLTEQHVFLFDHLDGITRTNPIKIVTMSLCRE
ncbi:MAG: hypothetical protein HZT42_00055 [Paracoccaceae bacterium]|nr:MAG: hypothetical protein HZT42_00055 [Paracoccaceae bacterium]